MNPIDKFTNIDAVYPTIDAREEDIILDYVWDFAMLIHPAEPKIIDKGLHWRVVVLYPSLKEDTTND